MTKPACTNNIAQAFVDRALATPEVVAVAAPRRTDAEGHAHYEELSFAELNARCDRYAWGLAQRGIGKGTPTLLMVRPGLDFYALTFALFKMGAVPIMIDPGMGWGPFMRCVRQAAPEAFLGVPMAHVLRLLCRRFFRSVRIPVTLGRRLFWGGSAVQAFPACDTPYLVAPVAPDDEAAVLFTTGSTGPAKGVSYTHGVFSTQLEILRREYGIGPGDVDLPCFPLFGLFSTALGATAIIPDMDPSRPAEVDPYRIVDPIVRLQVTYSFGSPTLWRRVGQYCREENLRLPSLTRVIMAGAPVPGPVHEDLLTRVLPSTGETFTPYGATEALPLTNFRGRDMIAETWQATREGAGMCVGTPLPDVTLRIIAATDDVIATWQDVRLLPPGEIGEVVVRGPVVTQRYHNLADATRLAKIQDVGNVWHRMGDLGYLDASGRLWFCGRKAHRVDMGEQILYTVCCEAIFNECPGVYRSALVGIGPNRHEQQPVIVIEPQEGCFPTTHEMRRGFVERALAVAAAHAQTRTIRHVLFHRSFPVDIRHNAKIRREVLAVWAARRLRPVV